MSKAAKGSEYERELCKKFSLWWTGGERDDVFWRSSQSGGRATQRAKQGLKTHGSYGDIAAVDPIGEPLIKFATIELKRGSSWGHPWDLFEANSSKAVRPFESAINQAASSAAEAGSIGWILIGRRDRKQSIVYISQNLYQMLRLERVSFHPRVSFSVEVNQPNDFSCKTGFVAVHLDQFLQRVSPTKIIQMVYEEESET